LEITRETKVVNSLIADYNFCVTVLSGLSDEDHVMYF